MDKLRINLIPPELKELAKKDAKRSLVNRISILLLGVLILITSGILSVVVYQSMVLDSLNDSLAQEVSKLDSVKDKEVIVKLLKNRLDVINQFTSSRYKQGEIFNIITNLIPPGIKVASIQINKTPVIVITGETEDSQIFNSLLGNLTDPKINEGKITSVGV